MAQATKTHPLQTIAETGALPAGANKDAGFAQAKAIATMDDRTTGFLLAQEAYTHAIGNAQSYAGYARRVFELTQEARASFIETLKNVISDAKKANTLHGAVDNRTASRRVASATTQVSNLATVAKAWNAGATEKGLLKYANDKLGKGDKMAVEDVGFTIIYEYASAYIKSQGNADARGRKVKPGIEKLAAYVEGLLKDPKMTEFWAEHQEDKQAVDKVAVLVHKLAPKTEAA